MATLISWKTCSKWEWEGEGGRGGRGEGGVYCSSLVLRPCPSVHSASTDIYTHMHTVYTGHFSQGYPTAANHFCNEKLWQAQ
jgi:hypothetical protein